MVIKYCMISLVLLSSIAFAGWPGDVPFEQVPKAVQDASSLVMLVKPIWGSSTVVSVQNTEGNSKIFAVALTANHVVGRPTSNSDLSKLQTQTSIIRNQDGSLEDACSFCSIASSDAPTKFVGATIYRAKGEFSDIDDWKTIIPRADIALSLLELDPSTTSKTYSDSFKIGKIKNFSSIFSFKSAEQGAHVYAVGFPERAQYKKTIVEAQVVSIEEAQQIISSMQKKSKDIPPFDPTAEFIVKGGWITGGMSGGPVFDSEGRLLGLTVRGGALNEDFPYARIVRIEYVQSVLSKSSFHSGIKDAVKPIVESQVISFQQNKCLGLFSY